MPSPERLLTVPELAQLTGLPVSWVYSKVAAQEIPHLRLGKYRRFRLSEVQAWLEAQHCGPRPKALE
jgi:excisionase family DNA binding protein